MTIISMKCEKMINKSETLKKIINILNYFVFEKIRIKKEILIERQK